MRVTAISLSQFIPSFLGYIRRSVVPVADFLEVAFLAVSIPTRQTVVTTTLKKLILLI